MKREVRIMGLSYAQSQVGSYIVVLAETNGNRRLPVVVKTPEAQTIALKLENMVSPRPFTHDLFKSTLDGFNITCDDVVIYKVLEGIFYCRLTLNNGIDDVVVEATAGDAIALSTIFDTQLYVEEEVLQVCGIVLNDEGIADQEHPKEHVVSMEDLDKMMNEALGSEDYEMAAKLRDEISRRKSEDNE